MFDKFAVGPTPSVAVVGGGIVGLTTAAALRSIAQVTVYHDSDWRDTTSAIATAMWHIYLVDPDDNQVLTWAIDTLNVLVQQQLDHPSCGIELVDGVELFRRGPTAHPTWSKAAIDFSVLSRDVIADRYPGRKWGYRLTTPIANMTTYLPWLINRCNKRGVRFEREHVSNLDELASSFDAVVNCSGLGSTSLVEDLELFPVRGQYVVFSDGATSLRGYVGDDQNPAGMAYIIPRDSEILVGGTEEEGVDALVFDISVPDLISRATVFAPGALTGLSIDRHVVGLRPCRTSGKPRFGFDPKIKNVFHNYGHGGSGFSLSWGCAAGVLAQFQSNLACESEG